MLILRQTTTKTNANANDNEIAAEVEKLCAEIEANAYALVA